MIYQPVNVYPNNNVVDASINNNFSWLFNGDNLASYRVDVYKLNESTTSYTNTVTPSTTVYGGDTVTFTLPANTLQNAQDYIWKLTEFETNPTMFVINGKFVTITSDTEFVISTQMTTVQKDMFLYYNNQYKKIIEYKSTDGTCKIESAFTTKPEAGKTYSAYSPFITTLNGFYFKSRNTPVVSIDDITRESKDESGNLNQRQYTFVGHYSQAQNVSIKYHNWSLYNANTNVLIEQTEDIYNSNIRYTFDGFVTGIKYKVVLNIETQDGVQVSVDKVFDVLYSSPEVIDSPLVTLNSEHNAAKFYYNIVKVSYPTISGEYEFTNNNTLHIKSGDLVYDKVSGKNINVKDYTILAQFYVESGKIGNVIGLSNNAKSYNGVALNILYENSDPIGRWYVRRISDTSSVKDIKIRGVKNNVFPMLQPTNIVADDTEYLWFSSKNWDFSQYYIMGDDTSNSKVVKVVITPTDIYYKDDTGVVVHQTNQNTNETYTKLVLSAQTYFDYATLLRRSMSQSEIDDYLNKDFSFEPNFDTYADTVINIKFDNDSLGSSNLKTDSGKLLGYNIYRRATFEDRLHNIGFATLDNEYIEDFMIANNQEYTWSIVPVFEKRLGIAVDTNRLYVRFDELCVNPMHLTEGTTSTYSSDVTWKFGLNIEAQDLTQNILKTKFEGLSRYPKFSVQKRNYISGGLTTYLTTMQENKVYNNKVVVNNFDEYSPYRNNKYIYSEPASMFNDWNALIASGVEVLIRDLKGHMWRAQIDANSGKIDDYGQVYPTTITWTFTEVGTLDGVSVINQGSDE